MNRFWASDNAWRAGIGVVFACICLTSARLAVDEFSNFKFLNTDPNDAYIQLTSVETFPEDVWGNWSQLEFLRMCNTALASPVASVFPAERTRRVAQVCLTHSESVIDDLPFLGEAYATNAYSAAKMGRFDDALVQIELSQTLAPWEGWLSQFRFGVLQALPPSDDAKTLLEMEVSSLLDNTFYTSWLASKFVRHLDLRELIIRVAETKPVEVQRRFLSRTRQLM